MSIIVTGASGFLGKALVPRLIAQGHKVYGLSRHPPEPAENLIPLAGDVLEADLGLANIPDDIHAFYHLAALHRLGDDKDGIVWRTNVLGTQNVVDYCVRNDIPDLKFCSTAYVAGRNPYERSKALCETIVKESDIPKVTIFKPSIVLGTPQHFYPGHFSQFVQLVIRVHQRAEIIRRSWIEGPLHLPVIEPVFRMKANPKGKLNLVQIDKVAQAMAEINEPGTYWLTHPDPPTLEQLLEWIGDFIMVRMVIASDFEPTPIEAIFTKMSAAFTPYLWGDDFPSDLKECPPITEEFITDTIKRSLT